MGKRQLSQNASEETRLATLDPTTPWYEFNSYLECCISLGVEPSMTKFIRYNEYYRTYGSK